MKVELFTLCDAATDTFGKLNLLGTFDTIHAPKAPLVHPQCAIAARLRFSRVERGEHRVKVAVINTDGNPVIPPLEHVMKVSFPDETFSQAVNAILVLQGVRFPDFGEFAVELSVDGKEEASLPLFIREMTGRQKA